MLDAVGKNVLKISIHALVKRATHLKIVVYSGFGISIHALVKRATFALVSLS